MTVSESQPRKAEVIFVAMDSLYGMVAAMAKDASSRSHAGGKRACGCSKIAFSRTTGGTSIMR